MCHRNVAVKIPSVKIPRVARRHLEDRNNHVLWSVGVERASEIGDLLQRLQTADIPTKDISGIEAVQVCMLARACAISQQ